jgi:F-type H+-transporting ATPase subunit a
MGLEFLARVRKTSTWLGGVIALMAATYLRPMLGVAFAAGAMWSLLNLQLLERLVVSVVNPDRATPANTQRAGFALGGLLLLFATGWLLLARLSPLALVCGFALPLGVIVAKAATQVLLGSRAWRSLVTHRFRAAFAALALAAVTWFALGALTSATSATSLPTAHPATIGASAQGTAALAADEPASPGTAGTAAEGGEKKAEGPAGFTNIIVVLRDLFPNAAWSGFLEHYEVLVFSLLIALLLMGVAFAASRNPQMVPRGLQNGVELVVEGLSNFIIDILGPRNGPRFVPFLGTLFVYILAMNLFGLIPLMHSPTASLNVTVALALTVFVYVQFIGFKELGPLGWLDHMLGNPRDITGWLLAPIMLPIHVLGELAKPISLSCRLFGNIFGEDMLLVAFASLGVAMVPYKGVPFGIPMHALFFPLALLGSALQAMVFTVLSSIYILLMLPHEHHDEHRHAEGAQHAH